MTSRRRSRRVSRPGLLPAARSHLARADASRVHDPARRSDASTACECVQPRRGRPRSGWMGAPGRSRRTSRAPQSGEQRRRRAVVPWARGMPCASVHCSLHCTLEHSRIAAASPCPPIVPAANAARGPAAQHWLWYGPWVGAAPWTTLRGPRVANPAAGGFREDLPFLWREHPDRGDQMPLLRRVAGRSRGKSTDRS